MRTCTLTVKRSGWNCRQRINPGVRGWRTGWGPLLRLARGVPVHVCSVPMFQWLWFMPDNLAFPSFCDSSCTCWTGTDLLICLMPQTLVWLTRAFVRSTCGISGSHMQTIEQRSPFVSIPVVADYVLFIYFKQVKHTCGNGHLWAAH